MSPGIVHRFDQPVGDQVVERLKPAVLRRGRLCVDVNAEVADQALGPPQQALAPASVP
jgi:hypothetical protein